MAEKGAAGPSISVITVTLNEEKNLPGLLENLRSQTDRAFDFLIVDGASRDGTMALVCQAQDLVTYHVSEPDFGFYDALNRGVRALRTEYYLVLGADDRLHRDAIANFRAIADGADIVVAKVQAGALLRSGYHPGNAWLGPSRTITSHSVGTLIRSALHDRFGFYSHRYPILADWHFLKRALSAPQVRVREVPFVAGTFAMDGLSNRSFVRTLCELWLVQRETGENRLVQYLLFQARVLMRMASIVR